MKLIHRQIYHPRQKQTKNFQIRFPDNLVFVPGQIYMIKVFRIEEDD